MFSRFDTIPACDGRTDGGRTDVKPIAIACFSIADARKNVLTSFIITSSNIVNACPEKPLLAKHFIIYSYKFSTIPLPLG